MRISRWEVSEDCPPVGRTEQMAFPPMLPARPQQNRLGDALTRAQEGGRHARERAAGLSCWAVPRPRGASHMKQRKLYQNCGRANACCRFMTDARPEAIEFCRF